MKVKATLLVCTLLSTAMWAAPAGELGDPPATVTGPMTAVNPWFFGMHIHRALTTTPWPTVRFKDLRLWDTGTKWADLEPHRNDFHFGNLDRWVLLAEQHQVNVLLTFGKTPDWASTISRDGGGKPEAGPPANMEDWRNFVRAVVTRYKGRIAAYEIWNEPSFHDYWVGDVHTMVEMTREAAQIIHSVDPQAKVVSPSATTEDGLPWFREFVAEGGAQYVDIIGYHFYVSPAPPEKIPALVAQVRAIMEQQSIRLPIWDTETGWAKPKFFRDDYEASAWVARSQIMGWMAGLSRFYWYAWDNRDWCTLALTSDDQHSNVNATAYNSIEDWMMGKRVDSCSRNADRTWSCRLSDASGDAYIFWNPDRKVSFRLPPGARRNGSWQVFELSGIASPTRPDALTADEQPRLIRQLP
jgi:hypothetical protein